MKDSRKNIFFFYKHIFYQNDKILAEKVASLHEAAKLYGFTIVEEAKDADIIASIGGDGTFLQAVRRTGFRQDVLYLGIDDDEFRGLYCDFQLDNLPEMVEAMKMEQVEVRKYPVIQVDIDNEASFYCLNEFTIRSAIIKTLVIDVFIDHLHFETFRGDGMVIATPTGSTAYNKSVRGAVVDPLLPCLQVSEMASLNSNRYRTLGAPFLLSKDRTLTLKVIPEGNDYPTMGMDNEAMSIQHVKKVNIRLSDKIIKTVKLKNNSFWEKVKRTFL